MLRIWLEQQQLRCSHSCDEANVWDTNCSITSFRLAAVMLLTMLSIEAVTAYTWQSDILTGSVDWTCNIGSVECRQA